MPKLRKIDKYDLYNNYIKTYNTQQEILKDLEKELGFKIINNSNLSLCLHNKRKTAYGYKWKWNDSIIEEKVVKPKKEKKGRWVDFDLPADELYYEICRNLK